MLAPIISPSLPLSFPRRRESILRDTPRLALISCLLLLLLATMALPVNAQETETAPATDDLALLKSSWERYKTRFIQDDGRVIDPNARAISTSEGQSYALLRAVWIDDRQTFDRVYQWTRDNLQVRGDSLFAWKWGQQDGGAWTVLDSHTASDADQDIALALLMADERWDHAPYRQDALAILDDIWEKETTDTPYGRVLLPGDWHQEIPDQLRLNPSYFAPYAYRIFAKADREHDWENLSDSAYRILLESLMQTRTQLPADWISLYTGENMARYSRVFLYTEPLHSDSDYAYNAIRVFWRLGLGVTLGTGTRSRKPATPLLGATDFLQRYYAIHQRLPGPITLDGIERTPGAFPSLAVYGTLLPGIFKKNPEMAEDILNRYVRPGLQSDTTDYYAQNWLWFGLALHYAQNHPPKGKTSLEKLTYLLGE